MRSADPAAVGFIILARDVLWIGASTYQDVLAAGFGVVFDVERDEVLGEFPVEGLVHFVEDEVEEVEAGDERRREIDVAGDGQVHVVFGAHGIGGGEEGGAGVEGGYDARFGYRDSLLFLEG
jgi:hypothetical protein